MELFLSKAEFLKVVDLYNIELTRMDGDEGVGSFEITESIEFGGMKVTLLYSISVEFDEGDHDSQPRNFYTVEDATVLNSTFNSLPLTVEIDELEEAIFELTCE